METAQARLTVLFEAPFWVGLFERESEGRYSVCKVTFGAEPKDCEVYQYLLDHWHTLSTYSLAFSPALTTRPPDTRPVNPKRRNRLIQKQDGIGTKAQQALKLQQEQGKLARRSRTRQQREEEQERKFRLLQQKKKEKRRGR